MAASSFDLQESVNVADKSAPVAMNILDIKSEIMSAITKEIDTLKTKWRLTKEYCAGLPNKEDKELCETKYRGMQLEIWERKKILDLQKNWKLSTEYCQGRSSPRNYAFCKSLLDKQVEFCAKQQTNGRRLIVDLEHQLLYGVKDCQLTVYSRITSGKNSTPTPPGTYRIRERRGQHWMQGEWFVNMAFYFYGSYALHDAGWRRSPYWAPEKRAIYGSHGCVNTPQDAMLAIWKEFNVGDTVQVFRSLPADVALELRQKVGTREPIDPEKQRQFI